MVEIDDVLKKYTLRTKYMNFCERDLKNKTRKKQNIIISWITSGRQEIINLDCCLGNILIKIEEDVVPFNELNIFTSVEKTENITLKSQEKETFLSHGNFRCLFLHFSFWQDRNLDLTDFRFLWQWWRFRYMHRNVHQAVRLMAMDRHNIHIQHNVVNKIHFWS